MDRAMNLTDGRVKSDYFPAGQLGKATEMISLNQSGIADIGMGSPPYIPDKLALYRVGDLPAMHEDACDGALAVAKLTQEGGILYEEEFAPANIRPLFVGFTPLYEIMTTDTP
jgi:TRAP-type C4-dicarboxylate transport system substrate-binding protein